MSNLVIISFNALMFLSITVYYYIRSKGINIGFFILSFYTICAIGSIFYHEHELFVYIHGRVEKYSIYPFLYLILSILVFALPILKYKTNKFTKVEMPNTNFIIKLIKIVLCVQIVLYIILFPSVIKGIITSNIGDYRDSTYDKVGVVTFPNYFLNILCRLYLGARNVMIIIAAYSLLFISRERKLIKIFFLTSFCFPIYYFMAYASRSIMIMNVVFSVFIFIFLFTYIPKESKKKIYKYFIYISIPIISAYIYISNSRFGSLASYMFYRYWGESFINYNTNFFYELKNNTWGTAYFGFFSKLLGDDAIFKTTVEKWDYIDTVTGIQSQIFYTFIGGLNIEFGFIYTLIIGIVLSYIILFNLKPLNEFTLPKFIIVGMLGYTMINGAFFFVLQGDGGNLEILFTVFFFYILNKNRTNLYIKT